MLSFKTFAMAMTVSAGALLVVPVTGDATQVKATVHTHTGSQSNLQQKKSTAWWTRHCRVSNDVKCGKHYTHHQQNVKVTAHHSQKPVANPN